MIESAEEFARLRMSDSSAEQRRAAVEEAPMSVWHEVISIYPNLREWVAINKTVPMQILAQLASDADPRVRFTVANKRKLTPELRRVLAMDADSSIRARIACNANCEIELLEQLANDSEAFVRAAATMKLVNR